MTTEQLSIALRTFIESGSANGNEAMRKQCLKLVFAAAPDLLSALKPMLEGTARLTDEHVEAARAAIKKATI